MQNRSALLLGATGLTGSHLLQLLLEHTAYSRVVIYTRKPTGILHHKLEEKIIDYDSLADAVNADDVFCCLGTTIKKAGSKEAFRKVDLDYPVKIARLQYPAGSQKFLVVSAMGASKKSFFFYSRVKATMEAQLQSIGYPYLFIFRPSLITGERTEKRTGEKAAIFLSRLIGPLLAGPLKKYRPVAAVSIAKAMVQAAVNGQPGTHTILSDVLA